MSKSIINTIASYYIEMMDDADQNYGPAANNEVDDEVVDDLVQGHYDAICIEVKKTIEKMLKDRS